MTWRVAGGYKQGEVRAEERKTMSQRIRRWVAPILACGVVLSLAPVQAEPKLPDFNGMWGKYTYNYPKPYMKGRAIAGGYDNPYLMPWVVDLLMKDELVSASGQALPTAHSLCYPEGVPYVFGETRVQILQEPSEITMLFGGEQEQSRTIYLNRAHPAQVTPSWYGDSVGHYEGDTLVVDTVGIAANPETGSMGMFGTPHTKALHLVERYRLLKDGEPSVAVRRPNPTAQNVTLAANEIAPEGRILRLSFTVDDPGAYKKPWSVTVDFLPLKAHIEEFVCTENYQEKDLLPLIPKADVPDF
jgi:hypothetical protein